MNENITFVSGDILKLTDAKGLRNVISRKVGDQMIGRRQASDIINIWLETEKFTVSKISEYGCFLKWECEYDVPDYIKFIHNDYYQYFKIIYRNELEV